jgi:hypothetical protein
MDGYQILLRESRVRTARLQAALAGNQEMILFYWGIDREEDKRRMRSNLPEKSR